MSQSFRLSSFLPYRLSVLSDRVSRRLSVAYGRSHGLSVAEWRVLVHLRAAGQVSVRDIETCVNLEKSRVSRAVARLQSAGLVKKAVGQGDGRLVAISLTQEGGTALDDILPVVLGIEAKLLSDLTAQEREVLSRVIEKLHVALDQEGDVKPVPPPAQDTTDA